MVENTQFEAFTRLVGEQLEVDAREYWIVGVEPVDVVGSDRWRVVFSLGRKRGVSDRVVVIATCAANRTPNWVLAELRKRELHIGFNYELMASPR